MFNGNDEKIDSVISLVVHCIHMQVLVVSIARRRKKK